MQPKTDEIDDNNNAQLVAFAAERRSLVGGHNGGRSPYRGRRALSPDAKVEITYLYVRGLTYADMADWLMKTWGVAVNRSTLWRTLKCNGVIRASKVVGNLDMARTSEATRSTGAAPADDQSGQPTGALPGGLVARQADQRGSGAPADSEFTVFAAPPSAASKTHAAQPIQSNQPEKPTSSIPRMESREAVEDYIDNCLKSKKPLGLEGDLHLARVKRGKDPACQS